MKLTNLQRLLPNSLTQVWGFGLELSELAPLAGKGEDKSPRVSRCRVWGLEVVGF